MAPRVLGCVLVTMVRSQGPWSAPSATTALPHILGAFPVHDLNITLLEFGDQIYDKKHSGMDGSFFKTWDHLSGSVTCRKKKEKESRQMVGDLLRRDQFARSFNLPLSEPLAAKTWGPAHCQHPLQLQNQD